MNSYRNMKPLLGLFLVVITVSFAAVSDSWANQCTGWDCPPPPQEDVTCDDLGPDPAIASIDDHAETTAKAGKLADAFSVSTTGEATYRIALQVPPGRAGMQPHLALSYDSSAGEGPFGMGFSLEGLSAITRCASNIAQDRRIRGVRNDAEDNLCLDGLRLVLVGHVDNPHSAEGSYDEYRTFPDTFRRVRAYYPDGWVGATGPTWLRAETKAGKIVEYGHESSGKVMGLGGAIRAWWMTQERDHRGNAIQYQYTNEPDPSDGHTVTHLPKRIDYTIDISPGATAQPTSAVVFDATASNVHTTAYTGGMAINRSSHIDKIRMLGKSFQTYVPVRSYQIKYQHGESERARIFQIAECYQDDSTRCRPPTQLDWLEEADQRFTVVDTKIRYQTPDTDPSFTWLMADVTGDGLSDLVVGQQSFAFPQNTDWDVARNLGGAFDEPQIWQRTGVTVSFDKLVLQRQQIVGLTAAELAFSVAPHDYNHDGNTDLLLFEPTGGQTIFGLESHPDAPKFADFSTGVAIPSPLDPAWHYLGSTAMYADVDGDGELDLIQCNQLPAGISGGTYYRGSWTVRLWTPAGFSAQAETIGALGDLGCSLKSSIHVVDIDRDGKADLLFPHLVYAITDPGHVYAPACQGFCTYQAAAREQTPGGFATSWTSRDTGLPVPDASKGPSRVLFLDVNGDGLPDAITANVFGGAIDHVLFTFLNTGNGYSSLPLQSVPSIPTSESQDDFLDFAATIDADGDGQQDLLLPMIYSGCQNGLGTCWVILRASPTGNGQFDVQPRNEILFTEDVERFQHEWPGFRQTMIPRISDVDGDGRPDIVMPSRDTFTVYLNHGPQDLLRSVTDGMNSLDPGDGALTPPDPGFLPNVSITYGTLVDHAKTNDIDPASNEAEVETYLPRTDAANGCDYPRTCVVGPRRVVASYTLNNGENQPRSFSVRYRDGRSHQLGRGFLGFGAVLTIDDATQSGRADVYDNVTEDDTLLNLTDLAHPFNVVVFPHASQIEHAWSWVPDLPETPFLMARMRFVDRTLAVVPTNWGATYFTLPTTTRTRVDADANVSLNGSQTLLQLVAVHAANGAAALSDTTDSLLTHDTYGDVLSETHATVGVDDVRTVTRVVQSLEAPWRVSEVTSETSCSQSLFQSRCQTTTRTYTSFGEVETEERGDPADYHTKRVVTFTRDDYGNVKGVAAKDGDGHHRSACVSYDLNAVFPVGYRNGLGHTTHVVFDPRLGVQTAESDPNGLVTRWEHDASGRTTKETRPDGTTTRFGLNRYKDGGPDSVWWTLHALTEVSGGNEGGEDLDSLGRSVRTWTRGPSKAADPAFKSCSDSTCTTAPIYVQTVDYDFYGRVARRTNPWMLQNPAGAPGHTDFAYDNLGRVLSVKTPWGSTTTTSYSGNTVTTTMPGTSSTTTRDSWGRPIDVIDGKGGHTTTVYGPFSAPYMVQMPGGDQFITSRDAYGRTVLEVDPDRGVTTTDYDGFDEPIKIVDALSRMVQLEYDGLGRRVMRHDDSVVTTQWSYDDTAPGKGLGRLATVARFGGATKSYTYTSVGQLQSSTLVVNGDSFVTSYAYDPLTARLTTTNYPAGPGGAPFQVLNEYDDFGNLTGVRDNLAMSKPYYWQLNQVNGVGQPSRETLGYEQGSSHHAVTTDRAYQADTGALSTLRSNVGSNRLQDLAYGYDARLNLKVRVDSLQAGAIGPLGEHFEYDELDRLKSSTFDFICTPVGNCGTSQALTYAANGNIATKSDMNGGAAYVYDVQHSHPHAVAQVGNDSYAYDAVGNQIARPGVAVAYTPFDLPKSYTPTGGTPTTLDYDGDQMRVRKGSHTEETVYVGGYERVTHAGQEPTEHRYYVSSAERVIAVVTRTTQGTTTAYLHADHLGSTDVVTDEAGLVLERRSYDAFGAKRAPSWGSSGAPWAAKTTVGFTSHESEDDFGLVNMKGRIYDPRLGRFLTTDPLVSHPRFSQSWNPYSYVLNNPLKFIDPSGFETTDTTNSDGTRDVTFDDDPLFANAPTDGPRNTWVDSPPHGGNPVNPVGDKDSGAPQEPSGNDGSPGGNAPDAVGGEPGGRVVLLKAPDLDNPIPKVIGIGTLIAGPVVLLVGHFLEDEVIADIAEDIGLATRVPVELTRRQAAMLEELRSGKEVVVRSVSEARRLLEHSNLKPYTSQDHLPGSPAPRGTYRGDLLNTRDPTAPYVHAPGTAPPSHALGPHYNLYFENGEKAAIIIRTE
jgi:RHS repeat-associated protein